MLYNSENGKIYISASELVLAGMHKSLPFYLSEENTVLGRADDGLRRELTGSSETVKISSERRIGNFDFVIEAEADFCTDGEAVLIFKLENGRLTPSAQEKKFARGMGFLCAFLINVPAIKIIYVNPESNKSISVSERPKRENAEKFFHRLSDTLLSRAGDELERITERLPSIRNVKFPYEGLRAGQSDFIKEVFRAIKGGRRLYACAPTGTGKTVSVLYPALKAMGEGACDKIFYFTPKATASYAATEAIEDIARGGCRIRAVLLTSKENICKNALACRPNPRGCRFSSVSNTKTELAISLLHNMEKTVITEREIRAAAREAGICPYELSLDYSLTCDIIICDYNYLFDTRVYLKRYFEEGGRFCFLIDEAHNLLERAREMYSAYLSAEEISEFTSSLPECKLKYDFAVFSEIFEKILTLLLKENMKKDENGNKIAFAAMSELPKKLISLASSMLSALEVFLENREERERVSEETAAAVRAFSYRINDFLTRAGLFSDKFKVFAEKTPNSLYIKTVCLNPTEILQKRLEKGRSAVLFSATMHPIDYYKTLLGGDRYDKEVDIPSPFETENLSITVMDKVATRYSKRRDTLDETVEIIKTVLESRRGNYIVFFPSFAYMENVFRVYRAYYPEDKLQIQTRGMSAAARRAFIAGFDADNEDGMLAFCVMGGVYSEGIDLVGERLIGAIIVGVGIPQISNEREAIREYFDIENESGTEYAYTYPGMNRVLQAAGRVIRRDTDRGVIVLIDDRFSERAYRRIFPEHWRGLKYVGNVESLDRILTEFWKKC